MAHPPNWHIIDNIFSDSNDGLTVPNRRLIAISDHPSFSLNTGSSELITIHLNFHLKLNS